MQQTTTASCKQPPCAPPAPLPAQHSLSEPDGTSPPRLKRSASTACSLSSSAHNAQSPMQLAADRPATQSSCSHTLRNTKRRRRSRARPSPPVTRVLALDKAHFKSLVQQFTDMATSCNQPVAPSHTTPPLPTSHQLYDPPAALFPVTGSSGLAVVESMESTLQILLACLRLLRGASCPASDVSFSSILDTTKSDALALLKELNQSQTQGALTSQLLSVANRSQQEFLNLTTETTTFSPSVPSTFRQENASSSSTSIDEFMRLTESMPGSDRNILESQSLDSLDSLDTESPRGMFQNLLKLQQDRTISDTLTVQESSCNDRRKELERLLFDGLDNEEVDNFCFHDYSPLTDSNDLSLQFVAPSLMTSTHA